MKTCIYQAMTKVGCFEIWEEKNKRRLLFGGDEHTLLDMKNKHHLLLPYLPPMILSEKFCHQPKTALILGLGGGASVHYLQHHYPEMHFTVVEKEQEIVNAAQHFFDIPQGSDQFQIKVMDALDYIKNCDKKFDLMMVDIFNPTSKTSKKIAKEFYENCASCLTPRGAVAFNNICYKQSDADHIMSMLYELFDNKTIMLPVCRHLNLVAMATHNDEFSNIVEQLVENQQLIIEHDSLSYGLVAKLPKGDNDGI